MSITVYTYNDKVLKNVTTDKWLKKKEALIIYQVTTSATHGTVTVSPSEGTTGTEVTLSNTPDTGYTFDKYTLISGTGATISGNILTIGTSNVTVRGDFVVDYNPLGLPANTVRVRTNNGSAPTKSWQTTYDTATLVTGTSDVYDVYKSGTNLNKLLYESTNVVEVLGANTTGITSMQYMFTGCTSLTTVAIFDTSSVTDIRNLLSACSSLTSIPLFDTSSVTNMNNMFFGCTNVQSGALALYQQASTQTTPPSSYSNCFKNCGSNTTTGAAELAQIPSSWGGTGA